MLLISEQIFVRETECRSGRRRLRLDIVEMKNATCSVKGLHQPLEKLWPLITVERSAIKEVQQSWEILRKEGADRHCEANSKNYATKYHERREYDFEVGRTGGNLQ